MQVVRPFVASQYRLEEKTYEKWPREQTTSTFPPNFSSATALIFLFDSDELSLMFWNYLDLAFLKVSCLTSSISLWRTWLLHLFCVASSSLTFTGWVVEATVVVVDSSTGVASSWCRITTVGERRISELPRRPARTRSASASCYILKILTGGIKRLTLDTGSARTVSSIFGVSIGS